MELEQEGAISETETRDSAEAIDQLLREMDAEGVEGASVVVWRQDDKEKSKWHWLTKIPLQDFSIQAIRDEAGGGEYRGRVFVAGEGAKLAKKSGSSRYFFFSIDSRCKPAPSVSVHPGLNPAAGHSELNEIRSAMREMAQAIASIAARPSSSAVELAEVVKAMRDLMPQPQPASTPASDIKTLSDVLRQGIELGRTITGGGGTGYQEVIDRVGVPLLSIFERYLARGVRRPVPSPTPSGRTVPSGDASSAHSNGGSPAMLDAVLKVAVAEVVQWSGMGADPSKCASDTLSQIPESFLEQLYGKLHDPGFFPFLLNQYPELQSHQAWLKLYLDAMAGFLVAEDEADTAASDVVD